MANSLPTEIYLENDDFVHVAAQVTRANSTTGEVETVDLSGRTDGLVFLSNTSPTDGTASAIHASLSKTLTETVATSRYSAVLEGSDKTTQLAAKADGDIIYGHISFGSDYHESFPIIVRKARVAA